MERRYGQKKDRSDRSLIGQKRNHSPALRRFFEKHRGFGFFEGSEITKFRNNEIPEFRNRIVKPNSSLSTSKKAVTPLIAPRSTNFSTLS